MHGKQAYEPWDTFRSPPDHKRQGTRDSAATTHLVCVVPAQISRAHAGEIISLSLCLHWRQLETHAREVRVRPAPVLYTHNAHTHTTKKECA
jgi:hypothetical protein